MACIDTNPMLMPRYKELESEIYEREQAGNTKTKLDIMNLKNKNKYRKSERALDSV